MCKVLFCYCTYQQDKNKSKGIFLSTLKVSSFLKTDGVCTIQYIMAGFSARFAEICGKNFDLEEQTQAQSFQSVEPRMKLHTRLCLTHLSLRGKSNKTDAKEVSYEAPMTRQTRLKMHKKCIAPSEQISPYCVVDTCLLLFQFPFMRQTVSMQCIISLTTWLLHCLLFLVNNWLTSIL